jgi:mRNA-degrading endonuclease RelE of RelBE toxin-antitoxin system
MRFIWPASARSELRAIGRETAVRILHSLTEYFESGKGDLKALGGPWQGYFRLRVGDYRIIMATAPEEITVMRVRHRSEAYR